MNEENKKEMKFKESFILYDSLWNCLSKFPEHQQAQFLQAIFIYHRTGEVIQMDDRVLTAFDIVKEQLDHDDEKYIRKCRVNGQNINSRWEKYRAQKLIDEQSKRN